MHHAPIRTMPGQDAPLSETASLPFAVRWVGHAMVEISLDGVELLTDPVLSEFAPFVFHRAPRPVRPRLETMDAVLISHAHHDHLHLPSLRELSPETLVIVPTGMGSWLQRRGVLNVREVAPRDHVEVGPVRITATPAAHNGRRVATGPTSPALGYLIQGSESVYFAGDTELFEDMRDLPAECETPLHTALLPVGGWGPTLRGGHMTPQRAAEALQLLRPRRAIPIHWGTYWPRGLSRIYRARFIEPGNAFRLAAALTNPETEVVVLAPGERVEAGCEHRLAYRDSLR